MRLRCWGCWGTGGVTVRGDVIPYAELTPAQAAEESVLGGFHYRSVQQRCTWCRGQGHWVLAPRRNRMKETHPTASFATLASAVDHALEQLRTAQAEVTEARRKLALAESNATDWQREVDRTRDEMFDAFPELRPTPPAVPGPPVERSGPDPDGFRPVGTEDPDGFMPRND